MEAITPAEAEQAATVQMQDYIMSTCNNALQNKYEGAGEVLVPLPSATKKGCSDAIPLYETAGWVVSLAQDEALVWIMGFVAA